MEGQESKKQQADRLFSEINMMIFEALSSLKVYSGDSNLAITCTENSTTLTEREDVR